MIVPVPHEGAAELRHNKTEARRVDSREHVRLGAFDIE